jgi:hypothetical protein
MDTRPRVEPGLLAACVLGWLSGGRCVDQSAAVRARMDGQGRADPHRSAQGSCMATAPASPPCDLHGSARTASGLHLARSHTCNIYSQGGHMMAAGLAAGGLGAPAAGSPAPPPSLSCGLHSHPHAHKLTQLPRRSHSREAAERAGCRGRVQRGACRCCCCCWPQGRRRCCRQAAPTAQTPGCSGRGASWKRRLPGLHARRTARLSGCIRPPHPRT